MQGNAREGFPGAWSTAKIVAKDVGFVTVVYDEVNRDLLRWAVKRLESSWEI